MGKLSIWAQLEAKPGKEKEVEEFLKSAQPLAEAEAETLSWYAIKMGPGKYGIFDTFADENGRNAHLNGEIAKDGNNRSSEMFTRRPKVRTPFSFSPCSELAGRPRRLSPHRPSKRAPGGRFL
jgi:quinol monooxygenase YgiN